MNRSMLYLIWSLSAPPRLPPLASLPPSYIYISFLEIPLHYDPLGRKMRKVEEKNPAQLMAQVAAVNDPSTYRKLGDVSCLVK